MADQKVAGTGESAKSKYLALAAMLFAVAMTFIDQTIVAIASPSIQSDCRSAGRHAVGGQRLPARAGRGLRPRRSARRRPGPSAHGRSSASRICRSRPRCAALPRRVSSPESWIIVFRVTQGISGAVMIPAALAIVVATFPVRERGRRWPSSSGSAADSPPSVRSPVATSPSGPGGRSSGSTFRSRCSLSCSPSWPASPRSRRRERIDWPAPSSSRSGWAFRCSDSSRPRRGAGRSPVTWLCIVAGLVVLVIFVRFELRTATCP